MREIVLTEDRSIDWSRCPLVEVVPGRVSGAPVPVGTRMPVQAIVDNSDSGLSPSEIASAFGLEVSDVLAILWYREDQDPYDPDAEA